MSRIITVAIVMIACGLQALGAKEPEQKPRVLIFHVTSVERVDHSAACKAETCSVVRYRVEGYADAEPNSVATRYVITCDEYYFDRPFLHRNNVCARFHTGSAYTAYLLSDSISFPHSGLNKSFETDYSIVSEKEIPPVPGQKDANGSDQREATKSPVEPQPAKGPEQLASKTSN